MTSNFAATARALLAADGRSGDAVAIAAETVAICRLLAQHLARLVGELGVRTLLDRSIHLARTSFPCLARSGAPGADTYERLRACLSQETPSGALDAGVHVLATFIELLERFIGAGLVSNLVREIWPAMIPPGDVKETT